VTSPPRAAPCTSLATSVGRVVALLGAGAVVAFTMFRLGPPPPPVLRFAWRAGVLAVAFFVSNGVLATKLAGLTWEEIGWRRGVPWFALGALIGACLSALALGVALWGSGASLSRHVTSASALAPLVVALLAAALFEELVFRGAPLALMAQAVGRWPATLLGAILFGAAHLGNPHATELGTVNIALAAILLSIAFWSRGGIPLAWGVHFGWNTGLGLVFGAPVSGFHLGAAPFAHATGARPWLDGGAFGPEGGAAATAAFALGMVLLTGRRWARPAAWLT
jgi:uncharacterized protein